MDSVPTEIVDVLGRIRPVVHAWSDGSWECPFCGYGYNPKSGPCKGIAAGYQADCVHREHCQNPACCANPHYPVERAREDLDVEEQRAAEAKARERNHEATMKRIAQEQQAREQKIANIRAEAAKLGACVRCALKDATWRVKYVKHRIKCPLQK